MSPKFARVPAERGLVQGWESRGIRFQDYSRFTKIPWYWTHFQDSPNFYSRISQYLLRFHDIDPICKFPFEVYPRFAKIPWNWSQDVEFPRFTKIPRSSLIYQSFTKMFKNWCHMQDFQKNISRIFRIVRRPSFHKFQQPEFIQITLFRSNNRKHCVCFFLDLLSDPGVSKNI